MSILDRLKANDEDVIRKVDEFWLKQLNDDELQAEFLFARGQVTRLEDNMKSISAELEARKLSLNEGKDAEKSGNSDEIEPKTPILSDNILKTANTARSFAGCRRPKGWRTATRVWRICCRSGTSSRNANCAPPIRAICAIRFSILQNTWGQSLL